MLDRYSGNLPSRPAFPGGSVLSQGEHMKRKLAVIAIGGNSLILDNKPSIPDQYKAITETVIHIADVIQNGWQVLVTHGNGPQVGYLMLRSEMGKRYANLHPLPLLNCVADTQGNIGFMIQQALSNELLRRGMPAKATTVVTQVQVDADDPKFSSPDKFIGGFYDGDNFEKIKEENPEWNMKKDANRGHRRVVPSPKPVDVVELDAIEILLNSGYAVIAGGGGGIPVIRNVRGEYQGVDAVIDKDLVSRLLANRLNAELLLISTGVENVAINFGTDRQEALRDVTVSTMQKYLDEGHFPQGSMGPKAQAAIDFINEGGKEAIITNPANIGKAITGAVGTRVRPI